MPPSDRTALAGEALRFALVGALGFAIDAGLTIALASVGLPHLASRLVALILAVAATFALNRRFTFAAGQQPVLQAFLRYCAVSAGGAALNYATYAGAMALQAHWGAAGPPAILIAVAIGSALAMSFNFLGARRLVFRRA